MQFYHKEKNGYVLRAIKPSGEYTHNGMHPYDIAISYQIVLSHHQAMNIELSRDLRSKQARSNK